MTFQKFNEKYSIFAQEVDKEEGKFITSIFIMRNVIETVYHLASVIFIGIPNTFTKGSEQLKARIFYVARDTQEIYGRICSLFNFSYGQFHIQESLYQKDYYDVFINGSLKDFNKKNTRNTRNTSVTTNNSNNSNDRNNSNVSNNSNRNRTPTNNSLNNNQNRNNNHSNLRSIQSEIMPPINNSTNSTQNFNNNYSNFEQNQNNNRYSSN